LSPIKHLKFFVAAEGHREHGEKQEAFRRIFTKRNFSVRLSFLASVVLRVLGLAPGVNERLPRVQGVVSVAELEKKYFHHQRHREE
jgi:hypothetical protein